MNRTIEQWSGCQPEAMATEQSDVARTFAFADAKADILELHRENERLRKDAERYRFLKAQRIDGEPGIPVIAVPNGMRSGYYMNEENADYAVDTAMKGTR